MTLSTTLVGDDTGLLKGISLAKSNVDLTLGRQSFQNGIQHMSWSVVDDRSPMFDEVTVARRSGNVELLSLPSGDVTHTFSGLRDLAGVATITQDYAESERVLLTCSSDGTFQVRSSRRPNSPLKEFSVLPEHAQNQKRKGSNQFDFKVKRMRVDTKNDLNRFGVCGSEVDLALFDLEKQKATFRAKNVKNHYLDLRYPIKHSDFQFVPESPNRIVTCTHQLLNENAQVRMYDIRSSRRPVLNTQIGKESLVSVTVSPDGKYILTGDAVGTLRKLDIRNGREVGRFKGFEGAVKSIECHPIEPLLASVGLGRHLVVHDINTTKQISKIYLKQKVSCVLFGKDAQPEAEKEADEIWDEIALETSGNRGANSDSNGANSPPESDSTEDEVDGDDVMESEAKESDLVDSDMSTDESDGEVNARATSSAPSEKQPGPISLSMNFDLDSESDSDDDQTSSRRRDGSDSDDSDGGGGVDWDPSVPLISPEEMKRLEAAAESARESASSRAPSESADVSPKKKRKRSKSKKSKNSRSKKRKGT